VASHRRDNAIDRHIGLRMQTRREERGVSAIALANALGLSASDLAAIEVGAARIEPSALIKAGQCLGVGVNYFFEGAPDEEPSREVAAAGDDLARFLALPESIRLVRAFAGIDCEMRRRSVIESAEFLQQAPDRADLH
jgi:transcriptional regulator with XRE-family HTH domain